VDSTAILVGLVKRRIRPDLILFANVGAEKSQTYEYLSIINPYLKFNGFTEVTVVRYAPKNYKHWPPYYTLEENCLTNGTLPSISFGFSSCSQKWKAGPQHKFVQHWQPAIDTWARGQKVVRAIGYDCSLRDRARSAKAERLVCTYKDPYAEWYDYWFPLQEWGWDRDRCKQEIASAGLPVPMKSSCFFCIAMKPDEVAALPADLLRRIVLLEARAKPRLEKVEGLWRKSTKKRSGSVTQFILEQGLLPKEEIERIQQVPTELVKFQQDYAEGKDTIPLGVYLHREFPEMYPAEPVGTVVVDVPFDTGQQSLFAEA
jgi:hypothetical protein